MEAYQVRSAFGESFDVLVRIDDHQVDVHRDGHGLGDSLHHRKPERDVRYETAVHHIDVDQVGVPVDHPDVRLQIEEIAG